MEYTNAKDGVDGLIKRKVVTKQENIETYFVDWYSKKNKENFYKIMKREMIFPEIYKKYNNTEKCIEEKEIKDVISIKLGRNKGRYKK